jgi:hypothetical protein
LVEPTPVDVIAYHEAGHAVLALYYARNVIGISVGQPIPEESHVYHNPPRPTIGNSRIDPDNLTAVWPLAVEDAFIECRILLGGSIAQAIHEGKSVREIELGQDGEDFLNVLKYLEDTRRAVPALQNADLSYKQGMLERLLLETFAVLRQRWVAVERLAGELVKRRELTGEDVVSIVYPDDNGKDVAKGRCCWHCKYYIRSKELFILDGPIEEVCIIDRKKNVYIFGHRSYPGDKHTGTNDFCDRFEMSRKQA